MKTPTALLLDDDPWALNLLTAHLEERFPQLRLDTRTQPDCSGRYDVYFLDNQFEGKPCAGPLAREIRSRQPDALIVAFSATLDASTLRELINAGCSGAIDKSNPRDVERLLDVVEPFLAARQSPKTGLRGAIHEIRSLLREWNRRLELAEAGSASK